MRFILSLVILLSFAAPSMAADIQDGQKPVLVKGSKSYQLRYTKSPDVKSPELVEPASGTENKASGAENASAIMASEDADHPYKKPMKLHGKK